MSLAPGDSSKQRRGRPRTLARDDVLDAALTIARDQGVARVSLRTVAEALGIHQTSIYTYVSSKDELLRAMLDEVFTRHLDIPQPGDARDPTEQLRSFFRQLREIAEEHVELLALSGQTTPHDETPLATTECVLRLLADCGLATSDQLALSGMLQALTIANALVSGNRRLSKNPVGIARPLDIDRFPMLTAVQHAGLDQLSEREIFERHLDIVFDVVLPALKRQSKRNRS